MIMPTQAYVFQGRVYRVIDGDTIDVVMDTGFHGYRMERIRLLGVNAPEMHGTSKIVGEAAKLYVEQWLGTKDENGINMIRLVPEWPLVIQTYKTDVFGRYLAHVWRTSDGACLNDDLLSSGNAVPFMA